MIGISCPAYLYRRATGWLAARLLSEERQLARSLRHVRSDLAALGFPTDDMSDEEFIACLGRVGAAVRALGVSVDEAAQAFGGLAQAWPEEWSEQWPDRSDPAE